MPGGNDRLECYLTLKLLPKFWDFFEINFLPLSLIILYGHLRLLIKYLKLLIHDSDDKLGTTFNIIPWYYISAWSTCIQCYPCFSHVTFIFVKHIRIYTGPNLSTPVVVNNGISTNLSLVKGTLSSLRQFLATEKYYLRSSFRSRVI